MSAKSLPGAETCGQHGERVPSEEWGHGNLLRNGKREQQCCLAGEGSFGLQKGEEAQVEDLGPGMGAE